MKFLLPLSSFLATTLLLGSTVAAEGLKSGPQPGSPVPGAFSPLHANGPDEGRNRCLV
jgi:hypothetical protein